MNLISRQRITSLAISLPLSLSLSLLSPRPALASPPTNAKPTTINKKQTPSDKAGRDLFLGIFFNSGPHANKIPELHTQNPKYFTNSKKRLTRDPDSLLRLADHLDRTGDSDGAQTARIVARSLSSNGSTNAPSQALTEGKAHELILNQIAIEDPTFFTDFQRAVTSGSAAEVDKVLTRAAHATEKAYFALSQNGTNIGDVTYGPSDGVAIAVAIVLVVVIVINVVATIDIKDTPNDIRPQCSGDDCACGGGGDCGIIIPKGFLDRTKMAAVVAERFAPQRVRQ